MFDANVRFAGSFASISFSTSGKRTNKSSLDFGVLSSIFSFFFVVELVVVVKGLVDLAIAFEVDLVIEFELVELELGAFLFVVAGLGACAFVGIAMVAFGVVAFVGVEELERVELELGAFLFGEELVVVAKEAFGELF